MKLFKHPLFWSVLLIKIFASAMFISEIPSHFIPFIQHFLAGGNPYEQFYLLGQFNYFPYPPLMLYIMSSPFALFLGNSNVFLNNVLLRIPLLIADISIMVILIKLLPSSRWKQVLYLFWASPIVFYVNYIHGQLDIIPIALLLLSLVLLFRKKIVLSLVILGCALAVKSHLLLVIPFVFIYLYKKRIGWKALIFHSTTLFVSFAFWVLPFLSSAFIVMVYGAHEQFRIFNMSIPYSAQTTFYMLIAVYLYLLFKAFSLRNLTKNTMFMFVGVTFTLLVTLIIPSVGWFMWLVPFVTYFVIQKRHSLLFLSAQALYILYILFMPGSDVPAVIFSTIPSASQLPSLYVIVESYGLSAVVLSNIIFTALVANFFYLAYVMHRQTIRTVETLEKRNGIPLIGIAGDSGSGKSTLASVLSSFLGSTTIVCGDDVHRWERGDVSWQKLTHLNPMSNRLHVHRNQMLRLKNGESIFRSSYDHSLGKFSMKKNISPKNYIIDEGLLTFALGDQKVYALKIFLNPDENLRKEWKVKRDVSSRGYKSQKVKTALKRRENDSKKYVTPQKNSADIIISFKKNSTVHLNILMRSDFWPDPFVDALRKVGVDCDVGYDDNEWFSITLKNQPSRDQVHELLTFLPIDIDEYGIAQKVFSGYSGFLQLLIFYCLHERLKGGVVE